MILFVIYRQFFAKSESTAGAIGHANPVSIDTSEIEEKLKKILENQSAFKTVSTASPEPTIASRTLASQPTATAANVVVDTQEIEKLKNEIKEKEKALEDFKKTVAAAPSGPEGAISNDDVKKFESKIKELEGRLQEYEIISEDIADLSFYKEENARLQKELSAKGGETPATAAPEPEAPAPVAVAAPPVAKEPTPVVVAEPPPAEPVVPEPAPVATQPAPAEAVADAGTTNIDSVIDDEILKEFAAAVEGQKSAESTIKSAKNETKNTATVPAGSEPVPAADPQKLTESKELMGEFENFIKKG